MDKNYWTVRIRAYDALHHWTDERRIWADDAPTRGSDCHRSVGNLGAPHPGREGGGGDTMTHPTEAGERERLDMETIRKLRDLFDEIWWAGREDRTVNHDKILERAANLLRTEPGGEAQDLASEILAELDRARAKFPGDNVTTLALVEEVGELAKATFEESREAVRKEAIQVATMAMRVVLDGDSTLDSWRASRGLDPLYPRPTAPVAEAYPKRCPECGRPDSVFSTDYGAALYCRWNDCEYWSSAPVEEREP